MTVKASASPRSRLWRLTLLLLVILPFLPEVIIYAVSAIAKINGCPVEAKSPCVVAWTSVSAIIVTGLQAGVLRGALFAVGISAGWLALCYVVINLGWLHSLSRLLMGHYPREGFGTTVIERMIREQLKGEMHLDWRTEGLACEIVLRT